MQLYAYKACKWSSQSSILRMSGWLDLISTKLGDVHELVLISVTWSSSCCSSICPIRSHKFKKLRISCSPKPHNPSSPWCKWMVYGGFWILFCKINRKSALQRARRALCNKMCFERGLPRASRKKFWIWSIFRQNFKGLVPGWDELGSSPPSYIRHRGAVEHQVW